MDVKNRKATFVLPAKMLDEITECVRQGEAHSISAFVREALERRLREIREERIVAEFEEAAGDPEFISDLSDTMAAFEQTDTETARMING